MQGHEVMPFKPVGCSDGACAVLVPAPPTRALRREAKDVGECSLLGVFGSEKVCSFG